MSFNDLVNEATRGLILQTLAADSSYSLNDHILRMCLRDLGQTCSYDALHTHLAWLEEQGLITIKEIGSGRQAAPLLVATLTNRGLDAGTGGVTVPGVKRPWPKG
jgi:hypothetical protein